jgi:hypothetical protein
MEDVDIVVRLPSSRRARRKMFRRLTYGAVPGFAPICCDSNDPAMVACGFRQRLLREVPIPEDALIKEFADFVAEFLSKNVRRVRKLDFEEWLSKTSYNEARKEELRKSYEALRGGRPTRDQSQKIQTFVKSENYPLYKWCRMINSRSDAFKVFSGPFFRAVEEVVYELPEFIKHTPVPDRPSRVRALRKAGRRYYQTDFTAFESHFSAELMNICECALYRHCFDDCEDIQYICRTVTGLNRMRTRHGVSADIRARRMSGDMCTSLGNGFTNLMLAKFIAHRQGHELYGFVEGDDGLFATEAVLDVKTYERLGFSIKIDEVSDPCKASFCGMVFADSGEIVRNPIDFLSSFGWTGSFISAGNIVMDQLLRAKALSAVYETPQCPIVGMLARVALAKTRGAVPRFVDDGYHRCPSDEIPLPSFRPSADTRELVAELYHISPALQLEIERCIQTDQLERIAPLLGGLVAQDVRHYADRYVEVG